jgi:Bacteriodetes cell division protein (FtsL-like)
MAINQNKTDWRKLLNYQWIVRNIPFFLFLALLAVVYIYSGHYTDKQVRRISAVEKNIKELEYEYKTIKSDLIFWSRPSHLKEVGKTMGLQEAIKPPVKLVTQER